MIGSRLTAAAERAGERYGILLNSFNAVFNQFAGNPNPGSPNNRKKATARAYTLAQGYLASELEFIDQTVQREMQDATTHTLDALGVPYEDPPELVFSHTESLVQELEHGIRTQLERDISLIGKGLRDISLRTNLVAKTRGITRANALAYLRTYGPLSQTFTFQDRAGRHWPSQKLIRTLWRHSLVLTWNETALMTMALRGVPSAIIEHPDESHRERGTIISLEEDPSGISWDQIRDEVFHPHTHAQLAPYVV